MLGSYFRTGSNTLISLGFYRSLWDSVGTGITSLLLRLAKRCILCLFFCKDAFLLCLSLQSYHPTLAGDFGNTLPIQESAVCSLERLIMEMLWDIFACVGCPKITHVARNLHYVNAAGKT